ncbi:MAG: hypothetical protein KatS3mg114_1133 [Planctomycetaceae bacterium]|nr:MAG: hypothetical protein KatS3mg114_1133 [Planctomycetaceae bacterium]
MNHGSTTASIWIHHLEQSISPVEELLAATPREVMGQHLAFR